MSRPDARPTRAALIVGVLCLLAAALFRPTSAAALFSEDGSIARGGVVPAIRGLQVLLALAGMWILVRGGLRWGPLAAAGSILLVGLVSVGAWGSLKALQPRPWRVAGLPMSARLELLNERNPRLKPLDEEALAVDLETLVAEVGPKEALRQRARLAQDLLNRGEFARAAAELEDVLARLEGLGEWASKRNSKPIRRALIGVYLRWGEVQNCVENHNQDTCLFPIRGDGVHRDQRGSRQAIRLIGEALEEEPDDLVWRWLLNVAYMTVGEYPESVPERWRLDEELFASEGEIGRFYDVAPGLGIAGDGLSGGSSLEDFDGDGDLDIVCSSMGLHDPLRFYVNQGDGTFTERTHEAGLSDTWGGLNINHADYDNDGNVDVFVLRGAWMGNHGLFPNSLLRNHGDGTFEDVTEEVGLLSFRPTQVAAWADFDNDGWLDLFIGNEAREGQAVSSELYRSNGDGTFTDVIADTDIRLESFVKGAAWGDYDNDGWPDLYVSRRYAGGSLYRNETEQAGKPAFRDVTLDAGMSSEVESFPCWFFDYDNDGWLDLFVAGYSTAFLDDGDDRLADILAARLGLELTTDGYPRLFHNRGDGTFEDLAGPLGLRRVVSVMGANFGDIDQDGWLDLYLGTGSPDFLALMANRMFRNDGGRAFEDVTTAGGFGHLQKGHGVSFGDIDNDGDQDVYTVLGGWYKSDNFFNALFENPGNGNRWITLGLEGARSNRSAIGARVRVVASTPDGPLEIHRTVGTGGSFGANSLQLEIGLGRATAVETIEVRWPTSGEHQLFEDVAPDRTYQIREGDDALVEVPRASFTLRPSDAQGHAHHAGPGGGI